MHHWLRSIGIETRLEAIEQKRGVWTLRLISTNTPFVTFGKGLGFDEACKSAYGEMCERLMLGNFYEDYFLEDIYPEALLQDSIDPKLQQWYPIDELELEDLLDFNTDQPKILSILLQSEAEKILFPVNLLQNLYASNGMACHSDKKRAYENALSEVIERYVKFEVVKNALALPPISHPLNDDPIQIYDASLGGRYPVMAASYIEGERILLAFGCHIDQERAIQKAYTELIQGLSGRFGRICEDREWIKDPENLERHFIDLTGDVHRDFFKEAHYRAKKWSFEGYELFDEPIFYRYVRKSNLHAFWVIVPTISEIYPFEDLLYNNKNLGRFYRPHILEPNEESQEIVSEVAHKELGSLIGVPFIEPLYLPDLDKPKSIHPHYFAIKKSLKRLNAQ